MKNDTMTPDCDSRPRLAFYGDSFIGSIEAMAQLQTAAIESRVFLLPPSTEQLQNYPDLQAFGLAGSSRSMSPAEMEDRLPEMLRLLKKSGAPIIHYLTSSTFDSAPHVGSIGKAMEIGRRLFGPSPIPLLFGAPQLGHYCVFGNLFASFESEPSPYRLDHHPEMGAHPITPMTEADIRIHLRQQTQLAIELFDFLALENEDPDRHLSKLQAKKPAAILFDILKTQHLPTIGSLIDELGESSWPLFVVGSFGVEQALTAAWNSDKSLSTPPNASPVSQLLVVSGGTATASQRQTDEAIRSGFVSIPIDPNELISSQRSGTAMERSSAKAIAALKEGKSVIIHIADTSDIEQPESTDTTFRKLGFSTLETKLKSGRTLGPRLGQIVKTTLSQQPVDRIGVSGGETSGYLAQALNISNLRTKSFVSEGVALCEIASTGSIDQTEIVFKDGNIGQADFWRSMIRLP